MPEGEIHGEATLDIGDYLAKMEIMGKESQKFKKKQSRAYQKIGKEADEVTESVERQTDKWQKLKNVGKVSLYVLAAGVAALTAAIATGVVKLAKFNKQMGQVATLVGGAEKEMQDFRKGVRRIASVTPVQSSVLNEALYQAVSAGITDTAEALDVLEVAAESAVAGATDTETAIDGITTAINAFNRDASNAEQIADSFFVAIREGKTTMDELSSQIGEAAPMAAELGISLESVLAATSALTKSGLSTSKAMNALQGVFGEMLKPTGDVLAATEQMGVEFGRSAFKSQTFLEWIQKIAEQSERTGVGIERLSGEEEALNALFQLTSNNAAEFTQIMAEMDDKSGSMTRAFEVMNEKATSTWQIFKNKLGQQFRDFGFNSLPVVNGALEAMIGWMESLEAPSERILQTLKKINAEASEIRKQEAVADVIAGRESAQRLRKNITGGRGIPVGVENEDFFSDETEDMLANWVTEELFPTATFKRLKPSASQLQSVSEINALMEKLKKRASEARIEFERLSSRQRRLAMQGKDLSDSQKDQMDAYSSLVEEIGKYYGWLKELRASIKNTEEATFSLRMENQQFRKEFFEVTGLEIFPSDPEDQKFADLMDKYVSKSKEMTRADKKNKDIKKELKEESFAFKNALSELQAARELGDINQPEFKRQTAELREEQLKTLQKLLEKTQGLGGAAKKTRQKLLDMIKAIRQQMPPEKFREILNQGVFADKSGEGGFDVIESILGKETETADSPAIQAIKNYRRQVDLLEAEYFTTNMAQKEFNNELKEIVGTTRDQLISTLQDLKKNYDGNKEVIQKVIDKLQQLEDEEGKTKDTGQDLHQTLGDIGDALSGLANIGDTLGLSDEFQEALDISSDLVSNVSNMSRLIEAGKTGALSLAGPTIGAVSSLVGLISQFVSSSKDQQGKTEEELRKLRNQLEETGKDIQQAAKEMVESARILGGVSEQGATQVEDSMQRLEMATDIFQAEERAAVTVRERGAPRPSSISNIVSTLLSGDTDIANVNKRFLESFLNNLEMVNRNQTVALLTAIQNGNDLSEAQKNLLETVNETLEGEGIGARFKQFISKAEREGILSSSMASDFQDAFDNLIEQGVPAFKAVQRILSGDVKNMPALSPFIDEIVGNVGEFGEAFGGAIEQLRVFQNVLGVGVNKQLNAFTGSLRESFGTEGTVGKWIEQLSGIEDVTSEGGMSTLSEIISNIQDQWEKQDFGAIGPLSANEVEQLIQSLKNMADSAEKGEASENQQFSRSVQYERSITQMQAEEQLVFLQAIERWNRRQTFALERLVNMNSREGAIAGQKIANQNINVNIEVPKGVGSPQEVGYHVSRQLQKEMKRPW